MTAANSVHARRAQAVLTRTPLQDPALSGLLRLAATPTFAAMALLSGLSGSAMEGLCLSGIGTPLCGMTFMYAIMSAFHSPPWLRLIFGRRGAVEQS